MTAAGRTVIGCWPAEYVGTRPTLWGLFPLSTPQKRPLTMSARCDPARLPMRHSPRPVPSHLRARMGDARARPLCRRSCVAKSFRYHLTDPRQFDILAIRPWLAEIATPSQESRSARRGALNAALVSQLPFARSGAGRAAQGRARAQGYGVRVFFAPSSLRAGGFWSRVLADEIAQADAFILLVGEKGAGDWQLLEYDEALDKRVKFPDFPVNCEMTPRR